MVEEGGGTGRSRPQYRLRQDDGLGGLRRRLGRLQLLVVGLLVFAVALLLLLVPGAALPLSLAAVQLVL